MIQTGKTRRTRDKPLLLPLCPPQLSKGLVRHRTRSSAVRGQRPIGMCVASNLNTIHQFIAAAGTTVAMRETLEETIYQRVKRIFV
jgi:hypothetical protein